MKVLLLQDVYNLGQAGEVKTVADGYGRNYLLPMGLATLATPAALKRAERIKQIAIEKRAREKADADALAQRLGLESFDKRKIVLREPIREVGTYSVPVRLSAEVAPKVTVVVLPEGVVTEALPEESTTNTEDHPSDGPADPDG
jgi:large subunit ribosomal protein L9